MKKKENKVPLYNMNVKKVCPKSVSQKCFQRSVSPNDNTHIGQGAVQEACVCVCVIWLGGGLIDEISWLVCSCMPVIFIYIVLESRLDINMIAREQLKLF